MDTRLTMALLLLASSCGSRPIPQQQELDGQILPVARPDVRSPSIAPEVRSPHLSSGASITWKMTVGVAGDGPAVGIDDDGTLVGTLASNGDARLQPEAAQQLFSLLRTIDFSKLPHQYPRRCGGECSVSLTYQPCGSCPATSIEYSSLVDLTPEFNPVYTWLRQYLGEGPLLSCCGDQDTPCGTATCFSPTEICYHQTPSVWRCQPVPAGCEPYGSRTCSCAGSSACQDTDTCSMSWLPEQENLIVCVCPGCK